MPSEEERLECTDLTQYPIGERKFGDDPLKDTRENRDESCQSNKTKAEEVSLPENRWQKTREEKRGRAEPKRRHLDSDLGERPGVRSEGQKGSEGPVPQRVQGATARQQAPIQRLEEQMLMVCSVIRCNLAPSEQGYTAASLLKLEDTTSLLHVTDKYNTWTNINL